jgi:hypothetical protein
VNEPIQCYTQEDLEAVVCGLKVPDERHSTVVLAEGFSYKMVETLGSRLQLEPEFFASHLHKTQNLCNGEFEEDMVQCLEMQPSYYSVAPFYSLLFGRYYHFPGGMEDLYDLRRTVHKYPPHSVLHSVH